MEDGNGKCPACRSAVQGIARSFELWLSSLQYSDKRQARSLWPYIVTDFDVQLAVHRHTLFYFILFYFISVFNKTSQPARCMRHWCKTILHWKHTDGAHGLAGAATRSSKGTLQQTFCSKSQTARYEYLCLKPKFSFVRTFTISFRRRSEIM